MWRRLNHSCRHKHLLTSRRWTLNRSMYLRISIDNSWLELRASQNLLPSLILWGRMHFFVISMDLKVLVICAFDNLELQGLVYISYVSSHSAACRWHLLKRVVRYSFTCSGDDTISVWVKRYRVRINWLKNSSRLVMSVASSVWKEMIRNALWTGFLSRNRSSYFWRTPFLSQPIPGLGFRLEELCSSFNSHATPAEYYRGWYKGSPSRGYRSQWRVFVFPCI